MHFRTCLLTLLLYHYLAEKSITFLNFLQLIIYYSSITFYNRHINRKKHIFENVSRETSRKSPSDFFLFMNKERKGCEPLVYLIVACFIALDFLTGLIKAFKEKTYTSSVMREGLFHKCGSIICVIFGVLVDYAQTLIDIGVNVPVALAICAYIILMEIGSIIENVCAINPRIMPNKLKKYFLKLSDERGEK